MKTIAAFTKPDDAHLLRLRLEAAGIEVYIQDENIVQIDPFYSNALGGVKVQVADKDVEAVRELLAEDTGISPEAEE